MCRPTNKSARGQNSCVRIELTRLTEDQRPPRGLPADFCVAGDLVGKASLFGEQNVGRDSESARDPDQCLEVQYDETRLNLGEPGDGQARLLRDIAESELSSLSFFPKPLS